MVMVSCLGRVEWHGGVYIGLQYETSRAMEAKELDLGSY